MKFKIVTLLMASAFFSCKGKKEGTAPKSSQFSIIGTWQLINSTVIEKGDTIVTDYTKNISFIKVINDTHFAFLQHDLSKGKDTGAIFVAGGGSYTLSNSLYKEHLEYCTDRNWENTDFKFTIELKKDTLIQSGAEIVESAGIKRITTESYVRVRP